MGGGGQTPKINLYETLDFFTLNSSKIEKYGKYGKYRNIEI